MSSGKIEGNFFKIVQNSLVFNESVIFTDFPLQKSNKNNSKPYIKDFKINFYPKIERLNENIIDNHFKRIKNIDLILKNSPDLTQKQKFNYCNSQRLFMKLYLRRISKKLGV